MIWYDMLSSHVWCRAEKCEVKDDMIWYDMLSSHVWCRAEECEVKDDMIWYVVKSCMVYSRGVWSKGGKHIVKGKYFIKKSIVVLDGIFISCNTCQCSLLLILQPGSIYFIL